MAVADETTAIVPGGTVMGRTDAPRYLSQDSATMKDATEFVATRLEAHKAACQDIFQDPLVQAALQARRDAQDVMARWKDRRQTNVPHTPERRRTERRALVKRQAE